MPMWWVEYRAPANGWAFISVSKSKDQLSGAVRSCSKTFTPLILASGYAGQPYLPNKPGMAGNFEPLDTVSKPHSGVPRAATAIS